MLKKLTLIVVFSLVMVIATGVAIVKYNQYQNLTLLFQDELDGRLIPHKANHLGKLEAIFDSDIRSFELDLIFRQQGEQGYFEIGHDEEEVKGRTFESYLALLQTYPIKKIWMDVKNISETNASAMLARLEFLDQTYAIKSVVILESSTTGDHFKAFSKAGYHTSYYLPTNSIHSLLSQNDPQALQLEAQRIHQLTISQSLRAVSFTASLYPFVKTYLEPIIADEVVYHTWNIIKFKEYHSLEKLKEKAIFKDPRIQTIIYSYHYIS
ncbi:MAG: hypothetical protein GQ470_05055 [Gammaproteobacteria bacterium]|nr:hypothetical protein [Gammaproteobacteria bacterium]